MKAVVKSKVIRTSIILLIFQFLIIWFVLNSCQNQNKVYSEVDLIEARVDSLLSLMTLEEKIGQMSQVRHFDDISSELDVATKFIGSVIHTDGPTPGRNAKEWQEKFRSLQKQALSTRLGIPLLLGVDAVHGQNTFDGATIFPHNIGMGATGNIKLVEEAASITALETQATGLNWTFSPCIAIPFNEKWGRVYESFSESTEMTQAMVKASVIGHQGELASSSTILATAKHYIGDGSTDFGKEGGETTLSPVQIAKRLLPPYRDAVNAGVGAVMAGFNNLSGIAMHAHRALIMDTLKTGMGFNGMVITDWKGYSRFGKKDIINAGVDMVMAVDGDLDFFQDDLKKEIDSGNVSMNRINDAVRRILRQKFRLGLFENPYPDSTLIAKIGIPNHRDKARQAVRESLVLLKNNDNALPLDKNLKKIVVVGEHASNTGFQSGGWTIRWQGFKESYKGGTTILDGIKEIATGEVVYDANGIGNHDDADVVILVVGETPYAEFMGDIGEGEGDYQLTLSKAHQDYINNYTGKGAQIVVVLISGRPLVVKKQIDQSDAFVAAWLPGSEGDGIAEVLFGDYNFTGKLPHSWPESIDDFKGKYGPNFWDKSIEPQFEFGFGLKY